MTAYEDHMNRPHESWCTYPEKRCNCQLAIMEKEKEFKTYVLVEVSSRGLPSVHRSNIIKRIDREMHLAFKGRAKTYEFDISQANRVWAQSVGMVKEAVHRLGEIQELPEVQGQATRTRA